MRLSTEQQHFINDYWQKQNAKNQVYLFGSRVDDGKKGGDIDILVLSNDKIKHLEIFKMKIAFCSEFGQQKMDVVNLKFDDNSDFKKHVLSYANPIYLNE